MIDFLRIFLWPFSLIYGLIIAMRNYLYDWGIFKSRKFDLPVIVIGNLAVGGTGKSPMTEYLIRLLKSSFRIATLSRGYGRNTKGFINVSRTDSATKVGDEPLQFKSKYPDITVAVCENRVEGVAKLRDGHDVILLDDAFQHRKLIPGLSILLLEYTSIFKPKLPLPAGDFRDLYSQRKRATIIVVSKSPENLSEIERQRAIRKVCARENQLLLFSFLKYGEPYPILSNPEHFKVGESESLLTEESAVLLVTGIANPQPLVDYLKKKCNLQLLSYPDHYRYTTADIDSIIKKFNKIEAQKKCIITTEKDSQRLKGYLDNALFAELPIWVIPIETSFSVQDEKQFSSFILNYCNEKDVKS